jgi:hypothetical protein
MKIINFIDKLPTTNQDFDIIICTLSPESRAINISHKYKISSSKKLAIICDSRKELAYTENDDFFELNGFEKIHPHDFFESIKNFTSSHPLNTIRIALDISCMPRQFMAEVVLHILSLQDFVKFEINFCYSLANFTPPLTAVVPNEAIEPVHSSFSGWPSKQSLPTSLITGLGYEPEKAEGASEYLDPSEQWGFIPISPVEEFLPELEKNNSSLIMRLSGENRVIKYEIDQPSRTFGQLEIVISDLLTRSNPILLPFGPKIFFVLCLIQSFRHPEIGVWHVTGETHEAPVDRCASGVEIGFQVTFAKKNLSIEENIY